MACALKKLSARAAGLVLLLALPLGAQQLYAVAKGVFYMPHNGVALSTRTGRILWRFASFDGQTWNDGHGHLVIAYLAGINRVYHLHITRICQLQAHTGIPYWCHEVLGYRQGVLDAGGKVFYLLHRGRVSLVELNTGRKLGSYHVPLGGELSYAAVPEGGMLALIVHRDHSELWFYRPHNSAMHLVYPARLLLLTQENQGALLLNPRTGGLFSAQWTWNGGARLVSLQALPSPATSGAYPHLALNRKGWIMADRLAVQPRPGLNTPAASLLLTGAHWRKHPWRRLLDGRAPRLLVLGNHALSLQDEAHATCLRWFKLQNGHPVWNRTLPRRFGLALARHGRLFLFGRQNRGALLLSLKHGRVRWRDPQFNLFPILLTRHHLIGWQGARLEGWSLRHDRPLLLWRVRFKLVSPHSYRPKKRIRPRP